MSNKAENKPQEGVEGELYNYLEHRIDKITSALYKVTDFLPDKEPLKWSLRDTALALFTNIVSVKKRSQDKKYFVFNKLINDLNLIESTLYLASAQAFISPVGFELLREEYQKIKNLIADQEKNTGKLINEILLPLKDTSLPNELKGQPLSIKDTATDISIHKGQMSVKNNDVVIDKVVDSNKKIKDDKIKDDKTDQIISFLRTNSWSTVKDISLEFNDVSQKTIQRKLLHLAMRGLVKKEGDKRWRKYALK